MAIKIDKELCVGCSACLKSCVYDAIDFIDRKAIQNDNCIHCGCVRRYLQIQGDFSRSGSPDQGSECVSRGSGVC